jgi:hypothetical protein
MPNRSANTATYGEDVAKIELNLPDDLLWQIDEAADRVGESRNAFLRRSVEDEVRRNQAQFRKELEDLWASHPIDLGGRTAAELIREGRDSR